MLQFIFDFLPIESLSLFTAAFHFEPLVNIHIKILIPSNDWLPNRWNQLCGLWCWISLMKTKISFLYSSVSIFDNVVTSTWGNVSSTMWHIFNKL